MKKIFACLIVALFALTAWADNDFGTLGGDDGLIHPDLGGSGGACSPGWTQCWGTSFNNPMDRRGCGYSWDASTAFNQCTYANFMNVTCRQC